MRVRVLLFGQLKEMGGSELLRDVERGASVSELVAAIARDDLFSPELLRRSAVAVNLEYAPWSQVLKDGDEVAILPPVSGGICGGRQ